MYYILETFFIQFYWVLSYSILSIGNTVTNIHVKGEMSL